jgi:hypothetical protein
MNFIEALRLAKQGKYIRNKQWSVEVYIFESCGDLFYKSGGRYSFFLPHMLNDDWEVYKEKPKTHTFQEAFEALEAGKRISRTLKLAPGRERILQKIVNDNGSFIMCMDNGKKEPTIGKLDQLSFSYEAIVATDWEIIEDV